MTSKMYPSHKSTSHFVIEQVGVLSLGYMLHHQGLGTRQSSLIYSLVLDTVYAEITIRIIEENIDSVNNEEGARSSVMAAAIQSAKTN